MDIRVTSVSSGIDEGYGVNIMDLRDQNALHSSAEDTNNSSSSLKPEVDIMLRTLCQISRMFQRRARSSTLRVRSSMCDEGSSPGYGGHFGGLSLPLTVIPYALRMLAY
eukprot:TRINITY_DN30719_c0_g1_i1.p2 TRINITY_DN30719_c0_g1~~TRINITY_DN30719_c0_g1_i1.p2  ORF type:complete len:109 (-),score=9.19 TRINITY_DN30719_c0_g1_i1:285-611(-)